MKWRQPVYDIGFRLRNACVCGGVYKEKFISDSYPDMMIVLMPKRDSFYVANKGKNVLRGKLKTLTEKLTMINTL